MFDGLTREEIIDNAVEVMDPNFDHPFAWNGTRKLLQEKRTLEGCLMDQWSNLFAKQFYDQQKAEQLRKLHSKKIKLAAITIGVLCLIIIVN